jgi:hypothetical protein
MSDIVADTAGAIVAHESSFHWSVVRALPNVCHPTSQQGQRQAPLLIQGKYQMSRWEWSRSRKVVCASQKTRERMKRGNRKENNEANNEQLNR